MKRATTTLLILLCLLLTLAQFVYATTAETNKEYANELCPQQIDAAVLDVLELAPTDRVVKIYNLPIVSAFSRYATISDVLDSEYGDFEYYVVLTAEGIVKYYSVNKWLKPVQLVDYGYFDERNLDTFFSGSVIKQISKEIKVHNVYYLTGENDHEGFALYYQTNMGDYVFFKDSIGNDVRYLMPAAYFHDYMKAVGRQHGPKNVNGWHPNYKVAGYAHYDIRNTDYDPNTPPATPTPIYETKEFKIILFICVLITVVIIYVIYRKIKHKQARPPV